MMMTCKVITIFHTKNRENTKILKEIELNK